MNKKLETVSNDLNVTKLGNVFQKSGLFKDARDQNQAIVKILAGGEMGLGPVASMTGLDIIQGNLTMSGNLQAAMIKAHPRYDYRIRKHDRTTCVIEFFQWELGEKDSLGLHEFSMDDAKQAGLSGGTNWKKYPKAMLFNRCISSGVKVHCPDVHFGLNAYDAEEIPGEGTNTTPAQVEVVEKAVPQPEVDHVDYEAQQVEEEVVVEIVEESDPQAIEAIEVSDETAREEPAKEGTPNYRFLKVCQEHKARLGERLYYTLLNKHGIQKSNEVTKEQHGLMRDIVDAFKAFPDGPPSTEWFTATHGAIFADFAAEHSQAAYRRVLGELGYKDATDAATNVPEDKREEFIAALEAELKAVIDQT